MVPNPIRKRHLFLLIGVVAVSIAIPFKLQLAKAMSGSSYTLYLPLVENDPQVVVAEIQYQSGLNNTQRIISRIENQSNTAVYDVVIGLTAIYSGTNTPLYFTSPTVLTATLPGGSNYGEFFIDEELIVQDVSIDSLSYSGPSYAPLTLTNLEVIGCCDVVTVKAEVENTNPFPVYNVVGLIFSWISTNNLQLVFVADVVGPGETVEFERELYGSGTAQNPIYVITHGQLTP